MIFGVFFEKSIFWGTKSQSWQVGHGVPKKGLFWKSGNFPVPLGAWACLWRTYRPLCSKLTYEVSAATFGVKSGFCSLCILIGQKIAIFWVFFEKIKFLGDQKPELAGGPWGAEKGAFLEIWQFSPTLGCLGVPLAHLPPPLLEIDL